MDKIISDVVLNISLLFLIDFINYLLDLRVGLEGRLDGLIKSGS